ncbi:MAG: hypothetical protein LBK13_04410 [Spirochaetales bacterium]|nr:hypothetical protein [Spirochaetales bacterium]
MKKALLVILILLASTGLAVAESPSVMAFELGVGVGSVFDYSEIVSGKNFGLYFTVDETFSAGYSFFDYSYQADVDGAAGDELIETTINAVGFGISPSDKLTVRLYLGSAAAATGATFDASTFAFGLGLGYDIFSKKDTLFSALTLSVDWLATRGNGSTTVADKSPYSIEEGGALIFGLKARLGI